MPKDKPTKDELEFGWSIQENPFDSQTRLDDLGESILDIAHDTATKETGFGTTPSWQEAAYDAEGLRFVSDDESWGGTDYGTRRSSLVDDAKESFDESTTSKAIVATGPRELHMGEDFSQEALDAKSKAAIEVFSGVGTGSVESQALKKKLDAEREKARSEVEDLGDLAWRALSPQIKLAVGLKESEIPEEAVEAAEKNVNKVTTAIEDTPVKEMLPMGLSQALDVAGLYTAPWRIPAAIESDEPLFEETELDRTVQDFAPELLEVAPTSVTEAVARALTPAAGLKTVVDFYEALDLEDGDEPSSILGKAMLDENLRYLASEPAPAPLDAERVGGLSYLVPGAGVIAAPTTAEGVLHPLEGTFAGTILDTAPGPGGTNAAKDLRGLTWSHLGAPIYLWFAEKSGILSDEEAERAAKLLQDETPRDSLLNAALAAQSIRNGEADPSSWAETAQFLSYEDIRHHPGSGAPPSIEEFVKWVESVPANQRALPVGMEEVYAQAKRLERGDIARETVQGALDRVALGFLPPSVFDSIGLDDPKLVNSLADRADQIAEAKQKAGQSGLEAVSGFLGSAILNPDIQRRGDKFVQMESRTGQVFRVLGGTLEPLYEAVVPSYLQSAKNFLALTDATQEAAILNTLSAGLAGGQTFVESIADGSSLAEAFSIAKARSEGAPELTSGQWLDATLYAPTPAGVEAMMSQEDLGPVLSYIVGLDAPYEQHRHADSTYLGRILANIHTMEEGGVVHYPRLMRLMGADPDGFVVHSAMAAGFAADIAAPDPVLQGAPIVAGVTLGRTLRGTSLARFAPKGMKAEGFVAGALPEAYQLTTKFGDADQAAVVDAFVNKSASQLIREGVNPVDVLPHVGKDNLRKVLVEGGLDADAVLNDLETQVLANKALKVQDIEEFLTKGPAELQAARQTEGYQRIQRELARRVEKGLMSERHAQGVRLLIEMEAYKSPNASAFFDDLPTSAADVGVGARPAESLAVGSDIRRTVWSGLDDALKAEANPVDMMVLTDHLPGARSVGVEAAELADLTNTAARRYMDAGDEATVALQKGYRDALRTMWDNHSTVGGESLLKRLDAESAVGGGTGWRAASSDIRKFIELVGEERFDGLRVQIRDLSSMAGEGETVNAHFNWADSIITLGRNIEANPERLASSLIHESWHAFSRNLPTDVRERLYGHYVRLRERAVKANPDAFDEAGRLVNPTNETYRWTNFDEFIAETFTEFTRGRLDRVQRTGFVGRVMDAFVDFVDTVRVYLKDLIGQDASERVFNDFLKGRFTTQETDAPLGGAFSKSFEENYAGGVAYARAKLEELKAEGNSPVRAARVLMDEIPRRKAARTEFHQGVSDVLYGKVRKDQSFSKTFDDYAELGTEAPAFKEWFGESRAVDEAGQPKPFFHGSTHDFEAFDPNVGYEHGHHGRGIYLSTSADDVNANYATDAGPDISARIEIRKEELVDAAFNDDHVGQELAGEWAAAHPDRHVDYEDILGDADLIDEVYGWHAKRDVAGEHGGAAYKVYLAAENPVDLRRGSATRFDIESQWSPDGEDLLGMEGPGIDVIEAIREVAARDYDYDGLADAIIEELDAYEGFTARDLEDAARNIDDYTTHDGELGSPGQFLQEVYREAGFDGIILDANEAFGTGRRFGQPMDGVGPGTEHWMVFEPEQIKSVNNRGTFDPADPRMSYSRSFDVPEPDLPRPTDDVVRQGNRLSRDAIIFNKPGAREELTEFLEKHPEWQAWRDHSRAVLDAKRAAERADLQARSATEAAERQGRYDAAKAGGPRLPDVEAQRNLSRFMDGSSIVDEAGEPLLVSHETSADFDRFAAGEFGFHFGRGVPDGMFGDRQIQGYLNIQNPLRLPDLGVWTPEAVIKEAGLSADLLDDVAKIRREMGPVPDDGTDAALLLDRKINYEASKPVHDALRAEGYDGIVYRNEAEGFGDSYIALEPTQFKSVDNVGTFDPADPRFAYSKSFAQDVAEAAAGRRFVENNELGAQTMDGLMEPGLALEDAASVLRRGEEEAYQSGLVDGDWDSIADWYRSELREAGATDDAVENGLRHLNQIHWRTASEKPGFATLEEAKANAVATTGEDSPGSMRSGLFLQGLRDAEDVLAGTKPSDEGRAWSPREGGGRYRDRLRESSLAYSKSYSPPARDYMADEAMTQLMGSVDDIERLVAKRLVPGEEAQFLRARVEGGQVVAEFEIATEGGGGVIRTETTRPLSSAMPESMRQEFIQIRDATAPVVVRDNLAALGTDYRVVRTTAEEAEDLGAEFALQTKTPFEFGYDTVGYGSMSDMDDILKEAGAEPTRSLFSKSFDELVEAPEVSQVVEFFEDGNTEALFKAQAEALGRMMGPAWMDDFKAAFGSNYTEASDDFARYLISGQASTPAKSFLFEDIAGTAAWAYSTAMRERVNHGARKVWDELLKPTEVAAEYNRGKVRRSTVHESLNEDEALREARVSGQSMAHERQRVTRNPEYIKSQLGVDEGKSVKATEVVANALGFIAAEQASKQGWMQNLVRITSKSLVPAERQERIFSDVRGRLATIFEDPEFARAFFEDPEVMRSKVQDGHIVLTDSEVAAFKTLLNEAGQDPVARVTLGREAFFGRLDAQMSRRLADIAEELRLGGDESLTTATQNGRLSRAVKELGAVVETGSHDIEGILKAIEEGEAVRVQDDIRRLFEDGLQRPRADRVSLEDWSRLNEALKDRYAGVASSWSRWGASPSSQHRVAKAWKWIRGRDVMRKYVENSRVGEILDKIEDAFVTDETLGALGRKVNPQFAQALTEFKGRMQARNTEWRRMAGELAKPGMAGVQYVRELATKTLNEIHLPIEPHFMPTVRRLMEGAKAANDHDAIVKQVKALIAEVDAGNLGRMDELDSFMAQSGHMTDKEVRALADIRSRETLDINENDAHRALYQEAISVTAEGVSRRVGVIDRLGGETLFAAVGGELHAPQYMGLRLDAYTHLANGDWNELFKMGLRVGRRYGSTLKLSAGADPSQVMLEVVRRLGIRQETDWLARELVRTGVGTDVESLTPAGMNQATFLDAVTHEVNSIIDYAATTSRLSPEDADAAVLIADPHRARRQALNGLHKDLVQEDGSVQGDLLRSHMDLSDDVEAALARLEAGAPSDGDAALVKGAIRLEAISTAPTLHHLHGVFSKKPTQKKPLLSGEWAHHLRGARELMQADFATGENAALRALENAQQKGLPPDTRHLNIVADGLKRRLVESKEVKQRPIRSNTGPGWQYYDGGPITSSDFAQAAYTKAWEIMDRAGARVAAGKFEVVLLDNGTRMVLPEVMAKGINEALDRAAPIGTAYQKGAGVFNHMSVEEVRMTGTRAVGEKTIREGAMKAIRRHIDPTGKMTPDEFDAAVEAMPADRLDAFRRKYDVDAIARGEVEVPYKVAKAAQTLIENFPFTLARIKMGMTTGLGVPNPAYYAGIAIGTTAQMHMVLGNNTLSTLGRSPMMTSAVVAKIHGTGVESSRVMVSKSGEVYSVADVARLMEQHNVPGSFAASEFTRLLAEDLRANQRRVGSAFDQVRWAGGKWQDMLVETSSGIDNYFRTATFLEELRLGKSPAEAAETALRVGLDYNALTPFERETMRNVVMFYSYQRKIAELFFDTLLRNPENLVRQMRLLQGANKIALYSDPELVGNPYHNRRVSVWMRSAAANQWKSKDVRWLAPPLGPTDVVDTGGVVEAALSGDASKAFARMNPAFKYFYETTTQTDAFTGADLNESAYVSSQYVAQDRATNGGVIVDGLLGVEPVPMDRRDSWRQYHAGDPQYRATNVPAYVFLRNLMPIPGLSLGRVQSTLDAAGRTFPEDTPWNPQEFLTMIARDTPLNLRFVGKALLGDKYANVSHLGEVTEPRPEFSDMDLYDYAPNPSIELAGGEVKLSDLLPDMNLGEGAGLVGFGPRQVPSESYAWQQKLKKQQSIADKVKGDRGIE